MNSLQRELESCLVAFGAERGAMTDRQRWYLLRVLRALISGR